MMTDAKDEKLRAYLARIDRMLAEHERSEKPLRLWWLPLTGMVLGAALFAAGMAFIKLLG